MPNTQETVQIWMRLGANITVDSQKVKEDPQAAIIDALSKGNFKFIGDSYVPENLIEEYEERGILSSEVDNVSSLDFEL